MSGIATPAVEIEDDTLEVADRENLERGLRVYVTALARVLNAGILPLDFRAAADELRGALVDYREAARLPEVDRSDHGEAPFLRTRLRREANHVSNRLHEAAEEIRRLRTA